MKVNDSDSRKLNLGKKQYTAGKYIESENIKYVMNKYKNYAKFDSFYIDLLFYSNICCILNKQYPYFNKLKDILTNIEHINISEKQKLFCKKMYSTICLKLKLYKEAYPYCQN